MGARGSRRWCLPLLVTLCLLGVGPSAAPVLAGHTTSFESGQSVSLQLQAGVAAKVEVPLAPTAAIVEAQVRLVGSPANGTDVSQLDLPDDALGAEPVGTILDEEGLRLAPRTIVVDYNGTALEEFSGSDVLLEGGVATLPLSGQLAFSTPLRIESQAINGSGQYDPEILLNEVGGLQVLYSDFRKGNPDIYHLDGLPGGPFNAPIRVDDAGDDGKEQDQADLTRDAFGRTHVVWTDERNDARQLYYAQRPQEGSFGPSSPVDADLQPTDLQTWPTIAAQSDGRVIVVWSDTSNGSLSRLRVASAAAGSGVFSSPQEVEAGAPPSNARYPNLAVGGDDVLHLVWDDDRSGISHVRYSRSIDGGATWSASVEVAPPSSGTNQTTPQVVVGPEGTLHVCFVQKEGSGDYHVWYAQGSGVATFGSPLQVDSATNQGLRPSVRGDPDGGAHLVWDDRRGGGTHNIYYGRISGDGTQVITETALTNVTNGDDQRRPDLVVEAQGRLHVVWNAEVTGGFITDPANIMYATGDEGALPRGVLTSPIIDLGVRPLAWQQLNATASVPPGSAIDIEVAASEDPDAMGPSIPFDGADLSALPRGRYVQLNVTLRTDDPLVRPTLSALHLALTSVAQTGTLTLLPIESEHALTTIGASASGTLLTGVRIEASLDGEAPWLTVPADQPLVVGTATNSLVCRLVLSSVEGVSPLLQGLTLTVGTAQLPSDVELLAGPAVDQLTALWEHAGTLDGPEMARSWGPTASAHRAADGALTLWVRSATDGVVTLRDLDVRTSVAPQARSPSPAGTTLTVAEGERLPLSIDPFDPDDDPLTLWWTVDGLEVASDTDRYVYAPDLRAAGGHTIIVSLNDSTFTTTRTWQVEVTNTNQPPTIDSISPTAGQAPFLEPRGALTLQVNASDPDDDPLHYRWTIDGLDQASDSPALEVEGQDLLPGSHEIRVVVDDGDLSDDALWVITRSAEPGAAEAPNPSSDIVWALLALLVVAVVGIALVRMRRVAAQRQDAVDEGEDDLPTDSEE